jgi:8-oxo-dGTP diphosphatase
MTAPNSDQPYELPAVTADAVTFSISGGALMTLLVQRGQPPFKGKWAIPGGFVQIDESLRRAAERELLEETGVRADAIEQIRAFGDPGRDPRMRVISVAFLCLVKPDLPEPRAADDAADARWYDLADTPELAFDHTKILKSAIDHLRLQLDRSDLVYKLLRDEFTLTELQTAYEVILQEKLDKRNFRRKILQTAQLVESGQRRGKEGRPARLYRYQGN